MTWNSKYFYYLIYINQYFSVKSVIVIPININQCAHMNPNTHARTSYVCTYVDTCYSLAIIAKRFLASSTLIVLTHVVQLDCIFHARCSTFVRWQSASKILHHILEWRCCHSKVITFVFWRNILQKIVSFFRNIRNIVLYISVKCFEKTVSDCISDCWIQIG